MSSLQVPLLFWKPGTATVPLLEISLAPTGGGATHGSVRRPFEVLDQSLPPLSKQILPTILPRFAKLEHYSCSYRFPPRDVDQFADEFPRGLSHLLMVSLAFYALGADETCGGNAFGEALRGWTATGYPDKDGNIQPVTGVGEKLRALADEGEEIASTVGHGVKDVLLPAANEADAVGEFRFHFVSTFEEALERVFGKERLARYARACQHRRLRPRLTLLASAGVLLGMAYLVLAGFWSDQRSDPLANAGLYEKDPHLLALHYASGRVVFHGPFESTVACAEVVRDDENEASGVVVGVSRQGSDRGSIFWLEEVRDGEWEPRWVAQPFRDETQSDGAPLALSVSSVQVLELLAESPGKEILAVFNSEWYSSALCILSNEGELLRCLWHCGVVSTPRLIEGPKRIVARATANGLDTGHLEPIDPAYPYDRVVFMIRPEDMEGRSPWKGLGVRFPAGTSDLPMAPFLFYLRTEPKGRGRELKIKIKEVPLPPGAVLAIVIDEWYVALDDQGNVVGTEQGDSGNPTEEPTLVRIR